MKTRFYLVDSNLYNRLVLKDILTTHGFSVCGESGSGQEAFENYEISCPDALIISATMPAMDGVATIHKFRRKYPGIKMIFSASAGQRSTVVEALGAGAIDFIAKPYSPRRVISILRQHFN